VKGLPLNDPPFREIIEKGLLYSDKTGYIHLMLKQFTCCFLSRPRRFGKTLLVDTLEQLFRKDGRELFRGLEIESAGYGFEAHPVVRITFGSDPFSPEELKDLITFKLKKIADSEGLTLGAPLYSTCLEELIELLHGKHGKGVVVLIDEYDAPVAGRLKDTDLAEANADVLRGFFDSIKRSRPYLRFAFCTGITKFALKAMGTVPNLFSDISLKDEYAGICGFTVTEFDRLFDDRIAYTLQSLKDMNLISSGATRHDFVRMVREWYDGYVWGGDVRILNPFSIISFFEERRFRSFWPECGNPTHLTALMQKRPQDFVLPKLTEYGAVELSGSELGDLEAVPALFHSGYLTISSVSYPCIEVQDPAGSALSDDNAGDVLYSLRKPNREVRTSYDRFMFRNIFKDSSTDLLTRRAAMLNALAGRDPLQIANIASVILSSIAHRLHSEDENYYHAAIHTAFIGMGLKAQSEVAGAEGQSDEALHLPGGKEVVVIEVKHCKGEMEGRLEDAIKAAPGSGQAEDIKDAIERMLDRALDDAQNAIVEKEYEHPFDSWNVTVVRLCLAVYGRCRVKARFLEDLPPKFAEDR
jgi:hypothetical protein